MKNLFKYSFFWVCASVFAQNQPITVDYKLQEVNLYRTSAELKTQAQTVVPKGVSSLIIRNVAKEIQPESLQIFLGTSGVEVLSFQFLAKNPYLDQENKNLEKQGDYARLKSLQEKRQTLVIEQDVNKKSLELLDENRRIWQERNHSSTEELAKLMVFYTQKQTELQKNKWVLAEKEKELQKEISALTQKISENTPMAQGAILLKINSEKQQKIVLQLHYLVREASWQPFYEIKAKNLKSPLSFTLKAEILQNTEIDWKGAKMQIINAIAGKGNQIPELRTRFVSGSKSGANKITYESLSKPAPAQMLRIKEIARADALPQEYQEAKYANSSLEINQLNESFELERLYDIPAKEPFSVVLMQNDIPADFQYITIPSMDLQTYLIAKIKNFSQYNLLNAKANVMFENMYVGKTQITANQVDDQFNLTLGNDPKISVKKQVIGNKSDEKFLSSYAEKTVTYDWIVKNNKKESVNLLLKDAVPVSDNEQIKVEILQSSGAELDKETGILSWKVQLSAGESQKLRLSYKIRYPKDFTLDEY